MTREYILSVARALKEKWGAAPVEELCALEGIRVLRLSMGQGRACKGFFLCRFGVGCIVVNADLDEDMQRVVLAHELGHALLHRELAEEFQDFGLFDSAAVLEREANQFAAELLIDDETMADMIQDGRTIFEAAMELSVPAELVDFKIRTMQKQGIQASAPLFARGTFLRDISIRGES